MKIEELNDQKLRTFVESMRKGRLHGEMFRAFLESNLDLASWGFRLSHAANANRGAGATLIYDSDRCRVRFALRDYERYPEQDELYVEYGRLHAPNDDWAMIWRGEKCRCWHSPLLELLAFLEGYSVQEVFRHKVKEGNYSWPAFLAAYKQSEESRRLRMMYPPAAVIREESLIWEQYGDRLFDVFDLRRPELWEEYQKFAREYWAEHERAFPPRLMGGDPPLLPDKIC